VIIVPEKRALLLSLRDPNRVLSVIPRAMQIQHQGETMVAVKHGDDEVRVLRNMGIKAPAPILTYYNWPGRYTPFVKQKQASAFLSLEPRAFNLSDLGTGKTLAVLWALDYLRSIGKLKRAVIIGPLSTLETVWADEIFQHFNHLTCVVVHGSREKRMRLLMEDADFYLINHDGIKVGEIADSISAREDITHVVVDEISQAARNAGTDRFKRLNKIINTAPSGMVRSAWGLTGTPTPNGPADAWAQCKLLVPSRVPPFFTRFKDQVMRQVNQFLWVPRPNAMELVQKAMQPAIRFSRDECVDLPPVTYQTRRAELSPEQKRAYRDMLNRLAMEAASGEITAVNEAVKAQKLIQIACGVVYDNNGNETCIGAGPRLETVVEVCQQAVAKVIIFVPFVSVIDYVLQAVRAAGFTAEGIHGGVSQNRRTEIFRDFQRGTELQLIVAQPSCMSHGLTMTAASVILWYAPITSNDVHEQANGRITRPGQRNNQFIIHIEGTTIEQRYYQRLKDRQRLQGTLLSLVQEEREEFELAA